MVNDAVCSTKIKELRVEKGVEEIDLAAAMGLDMTMYRVLEGMPSKFGMEKLAIIAEKLGVTLEELGVTEG